jgi:hypothetical protein
MVQVHHDEGVANRIGPKSCAVAREGNSEALTGECTGQSLSRESTLIPGVDVVPLTEGNTDGRDSASAQTARRGRRHWHVRTLFVRAKGGGRGECESAKHGPGTVPGNRVTGAEAHTARRENIAQRRHVPEVGAVCPNWARTDLCGGREVTRVPTAIIAVSERHVCF